MPLPPLPLRRLVLAPAVVLLGFVLLSILPLWLLITLAAMSMVPGRLRLPRVLWMMIFYILWDAAALLAMLGLWLASGFGWRIRSPRFQRAHYALTGAFLHVLFNQARWVLRLRIRTVGDGSSAGFLRDPNPPERPLIVACRHAGPGDSFILVHTLINRAHRETRIVLKDTLQWDPAIDVMLNRLPSRFIAPAPPTGPARNDRLADQVGQLARGLDGDDAFVIFPEGGNFTPDRRLRRIDRLREDGASALADRASAMRNVMAPRTGGLFAALDAAPDADVVFVGHTGLDRMVTVADIWRELPMDKQIVMHGWHVRAEDVPTTDQARRRWLYDWFATIDDWIDENRPLEGGP
ncbi:1-acyl-sn-glycerol-3-phosphate acyltransferase [Nocardiopsis sp. HNM0947]|uniref:1-acyl-sn-glycerol-3-phosphate acyltransferase n=1 Tax=Nocardiopsis coralli TaxID=2772213 RepID=A0ABR9PCJ3_9ACTN|nr:1-acyl-sn-glycerol-3-phosphate acyltransferase [Nocardiopsis coralli]MBE3001551.1 1-acyl-sn-glycerol-3-phosphate acyltransferase [Nocardiopsis coralli]